jgi:hypothetical protein
MRERHTHTHTDMHIWKRGRTTRFLYSYTSEADSRMTRCKLGKHHIHVLSGFRPFGTHAQSHSIVLLQQSGELRS